MHEDGRLRTQDHEGDRELVARVLRCGLYRPPGMPTQQVVGEVFAIEAPIAAADATVGDLIVWTYTSDTLREHARGRVWPVPRGALALVARDVEGGAVRFLDGTWSRFMQRSLGREPVKSLIRDLKDGRRHRGRDETSPCWIIRPWGATSRSIEATNDDAAIFELLHQVGGRMPA